MELYPEHAAAKLGATVIKDRLSSLVKGDAGRDRLQRMSPDSDVSFVQDQLKRVRELGEAFEYDDSVPLSHLTDIRDILRRARPEDAFVSPEALRTVRRLLTTVRHLEQYFEQRQERYPAIYTVSSRLLPQPQIEEGIQEVIDEQQLRVRDNASALLGEIRARIRSAQSELREALQDELRKASRKGHAAGEQPTIRNGRMVIPVRREAKRKVDGFIHDTSSSGQTVYIEPTACLELNNEVRDLEARETEEVERILRETTGLLRTAYDELHQNVRIIGQFDLLQAKVKLAEELDCAVPRVNRTGKIVITDGRNPVLQYRLRDEDQNRVSETDHVIPLDLQLGEEFNTLVITGPNAGGKTVTLKTVGLFVWMTACGIPIPANGDTTEISLFEDLYVDIGDEQSIQKDLSTFSSHLSTLRHTVKNATDASLVLIDEAGTGTDPDEGSALARSILEYLTEVGARSMVTTHHGALKVYAQTASGVENGSMEFDQGSLSPTYRFRSGVPGSSYAFEIAGRLGFPEDLLDRARELVGEQKTEMEELIAELETRTKELEQELEEARGDAKEARARRKEYEEKLEKLRSEADAIRSNALEEAERIVDEANARIERTIREIKEAQAEKEATQQARENLEQFQEEVASRRQQTEPSKAGADEAEADEGGGPLHEGDTVVLSDSNAKGEVVEVDNGSVTVMVGQMRMRTDRSQLRKVEADEEPDQSPSRRSSRHGARSTMTMDRRINLRGYRVEDALFEVERLIDDAIAAGLSSVEILHGKGTGALRQAIHNYLRRRKEVDDFSDAPLEQGGAGVTRVALK